ncbi:FKRP [Branchiostoma lanceolatum]|uniref:Ribitol-5-phosphate transferase n=1 Tax=Branchiostoma lanceolatum TaxID=7740 RepID=A0A8J9Z2E2_BRALA|nr:FKRP [Branchiostoma lanceolatum]
MLRKICACKKRVRYVNVTRRCAVWGGLVCLFLCSLLHFYVLPGAMAGYNDDCYLSREQLEDMRHLVVTVCQVLEELNQTYWLDYGTLLGAVRMGDVLPHDADVDISRLKLESSAAEWHFGSRFRQRLRDFGIEGNAMMAMYRGATADLFNWDLVVQKAGKSHKPLAMLRYSISTGETFIEGLKYLTANVDLPKSLVLPTTKMTFREKQLRVPRDYRRVLAERYPLTWWVRFPYKWKCWLPWVHPPGPKKLLNMFA